MCMLCLMLLIDKTGFMIMALEAIFLHELGHIIMLCCMGCKPKKIELKVGAAVIGGRFTLSKKGEIFVAVAGSAANLFIFVILFVAFCLWGNAVVLNRSLVMLIIGVFNLLPIQGLDGGTVIFQLIVGRFRQNRVKIITLTLSVVFIGMIFLLGIMIFISSKNNPSLILLSLYLIFGILLSKKQKE